ncbi:MAG: hypothetical protein A2504_08225 [Bdellovibrionales bacterium RIFOXYD12_FULL_39_22]|nr:MAG: hypothetical protein A2385_01450 [Bdellovibrionales bacterium RIFOXYB1_FULL_39_21]OFZ42889.1 MAG: hypothetical protein A2485_10920 [Bdellovibrionales bacterium RIFOXYC12_FULL_39_17]OFZ47451.1 MAG: hypothetical protein A2404_14370 [Bdellovibrionales bacterium RIFOXYC1_FULL_39_130]OFZ75539.1 MAG: hypothetical protein A2560_14520 [Bdellovibrionales bacterium RIFOXYD1_FULL_39_84]OFZ93862.1 MAG: hypothetical protein A2504_08225 [Bdellovibrionales bacterium RIFOXYD12_FULL_39_22]HLE10133.1 cl
MNLPTSNGPQNCPLCDSADHSSFFNNRYHRCHLCDLIFLLSKWQISPEEKNHRYAQHQNSLEDYGYRKFLSQIITPLSHYLFPNARGLDFGCGPGPTLSKMLQEQNCNMRIYDPLFFPDHDALKSKYDFVSCTEVVEHFENPKNSWNLLAGLVLPGGILGVMTDIYNDNIDFKNWYYKNDPTHVAFYSTKTFSWIATALKMEIKYQDERTIIFRLSPPDRQTCAPPMSHAL